MSSDKKKGTMGVGREPVVRTGLKLLKKGGLEGLTLRKIAAELGVQAPTLYWRFKNKQDLIDEMATQVIADWVPKCMKEFSKSPSWQERTLIFGKSLRAALLRYRDGARMIAGSYMTDTTLYEVMEALLETYNAMGNKRGDATVYLHTVYSFVIGFTIEEQAVLSPKGERNPKYDLSAREARIDPARYPLTRAAGPDFFENYDTRFDRGLRMIIAGLAQDCAKESTARHYAMGAGHADC